MRRPRCCVRPAWWWVWGDRRGFTDEEVEVIARFTGYQDLEQADMAMMPTSGS
jgi:hypothetical protein